MPGMSSLLKLLNKVGLSVFFLLLITMIFVAWLFPSPGMKGSLFPMTWIAQYGPALIFFFYGLKLSPDDLKAGVKNWPLHLAIQATTFIVFPLVILAIKFVFGSVGDPNLWLGAFYLAALPSTVSSSVVLVSIAGGDIPLAVLNASLSSLLGIVLTPLWLSLFLVTGTTSMDLGPTILSLAFQVLLPVLLGVSLNRFWGGWAAKNKKLLKMSDQFVILMIVYCAFCESFGTHQFDTFSPLSIVVLGALMLGLFLAVFFALDALAKVFGVKRPQRIALLFCGSKKSLVQGASMSPVLFPHIAGGVVLLPLMLYHALQLMAGSVIAQKMGAHKPSEN
jgi:sodium/bile acid cotransporter 7